MPCSCDALLSPGRDVMALSRALSSMVFGVSVRDPSTFVAVPLMLAGVALAASAVPAIRASRVNPITALRLD